MLRFDAKDPSEAVVLTYDFTAGLATGETLTGTPTVTCALFSGVDASPSAVLAGPESISGSTVLVAVHGGLDGCSYDIKVVCTTSNAEKILALGAILPVVAE